MLNLKAHKDCTECPVIYEALNIIVHDKDTEGLLNRLTAHISTLHNFIDLEDQENGELRQKLERYKSQKLSRWGWGWGRGWNRFNFKSKYTLDK